MNRDIKPLRICEHCGYLGTDGYEYPESYCTVGVGDDDPLLVCDKSGNLGCIYTDRQLKLKKQYIDGRNEENPEPSNIEDLFS